MAMDPVVVSASAQQISFSVMWENQVIYIAAIYASTSHVIRRELWLELASLQENFPGPWCFIGDYNAVIGVHEKRGGGNPLQVSCDEFKAWIDSCQLTHFLTRGAEFT